MDRATDVERWRKIQQEVMDRHRKVLGNVFATAMLHAADAYTGRQDVVLPDNHSDRVSAALLALYEDITQRMGTDIIEQFKDGYPDMELKGAEANGLFQRIWADFMESYGASRVVQIAATTRRQIAGIIRSGLAAGLSSEDIAKAIRERTNIFSALRSAVISATETHSAAMYASTNVAKASIVPLVKEWVSVEDGRTRDFGEADGVVDEFNHRIMDGQRQALDQPYRIPSEYGLDEMLMFPGDPSGSAANIINCRCSQVYVRA
jgi:hypothetical protein